MPTRSSSPLQGSPDQDNDDRLARLEALLSNQLYSTTPLPPPTTIIHHQEVEQDDDSLVSFRLFSSQRVPSKVLIKEQSPPSLFHRKDPRIRDVQDEHPSIVQQRFENIEKVAITGQEILLQSNKLPIPHSPSYRLTNRQIRNLPQAPSDSTREQLVLPRLGYLNSILPRTLHKLSPPTSSTSPPKEPNEGLINRGPYTVGKLGKGIQKRLPLQLQDPITYKIALKVLPILPQEKLNLHVWEKSERKKLMKEKEKDRKKKLKLKLLKEKHGQVNDQDGKDKKKKKKKGRLSKERRERAKKRLSKKEA